MAKDYYQILGVTKNASQEELKKAYYKLAHQHHPNKGGNEAKMKEINEAYSVLGNKEKRQQYDQFGQTFDQASRQGGFGGGGFSDFSDFAQSFRGGQQGGNFSFDMGDLGDMFGDLFGMGGRRSSGARTSKGRDIEAELTIEFSEAAFGVEKELTLNKDVTCNNCKGSGAEPGSKVNTCPTCQGTGQILKSIGFGIGFPSVCPDCQGAGKKAEKSCGSCHGKGVLSSRESFKVKIPAGIDNGQTVRLPGKGQAARGGQSGDLYLHIKVLPDLRFRRDGYDLRSKKEISFTQAALGDKIEIETIDGKIKLKIPEGTQSGKIFRIRGKGVSQLHGRGRGDHLVEIIVKTPTNLSRSQKKALKDLEEL